MATEGEGRPMTLREIMKAEEPASSALVQMQISHAVRQKALEWADRVSERTGVADTEGLVGIAKRIEKYLLTGE